MRQGLESVLALLLCLLISLLFFLGGLSLVFPAPGRTWAFVRINPLLLFWLQAVFFLISFVAALAIAWGVGRWLPLLRRGLSYVYREWRRLAGEPQG